MKKSILFSICLICISILCSASIKCDGGDEIPIPLTPVVNGAGGGPRSPIPVTAIYDIELNHLYITLLHTEGETATVSVINQNTFETYSSIVSEGRSCINLSGDTGLWSISVSLASGQTYMGEFYL